MDREIQNLIISASMDRNCFLWDLDMWKYQLGGIVLRIISSIPSPNVIVITSKVFNEIITKINVEELYVGSIKDDDLYLGGYILGIPIIVEPSSNTEFILIDSASNIEMHKIKGLRISR